MIAKVVVNNNAKQTNRLFDYEIPEDLDVRTGSHVLVPFGAGNKLSDGYVLHTAEKSRYSRLKKIDSVRTDLTLFDEKAATLAEYMRETYFCTYNDAIRVMLPPGTAVKPCEHIVLTDGADKLTPKEKKIADILLQHGGSMEINSLMSYFDTAITTQLANMRKKGAVASELCDSSRVSDKMIRAAFLNDGADFSSCTPKQRRAAEILLYNDYVSVADLVRFSDTSYSVVSALAKKGIIGLCDMEILRSPLLTSTVKRDTPPPLTEEQTGVVQRLTADIDSSKLCEELLFGVTGSGKTEVYMRAIEHTVKLGKTAVMLVPEISLTPQTVARFQARFGNRIAVFHSALSLGERYDEWKRMRTGRADIVIGARSAVFCPLDNIGVIIIDEQHEHTYKSETTPRYITSEIARFRAKQHSALLLQASATPSVTDYYRAQKGECGLLKMTKRPQSAVLPEVEIVDMCGELHSGNRCVLGRRLAEEIQKNLDRKEQTVLLLNRRGYSTFVSCRSCGYVAECPNCSISLTYHKVTDSMHCHYCGYSAPAPRTCPTCGSPYIRYFGGGTQKVEEDLHRMFPNASVIRMDVDTVSGKGGHERLLERFQRENTDILIGTQMIAKGLDFPKVTLAGVISADTVLNIDAYTSSERAFALLEQVAGRAGRADKKGRAIIQTYTPEHDAVVKMKSHDYEGFFRNEIKVRRSMWYPPICDMLSVLVSGRDEKIAMRAARSFKKQLAPIGELCARYQILGPIPDYISKIKNRYRFKMIIKCDNARNINTLLSDALAESGSIYKDISFVISRE